MGGLTSSGVVASLSSMITTLWVFNGVDDVAKRACHLASALKC